MKFNKALFKQCLKTNGTSWLVVTILECLMLAAIMGISGGSSIGGLISSIKTSIVKSEIDSYVTKMSLNFYSLGILGQSEFDREYAIDFENYHGSIASYASDVDTWYSVEPTRSDYSTDEDFESAYAAWETSIPAYDNAWEESYQAMFTAWMDSRDTVSDEEYLSSRPNAVTFSRDNARKESNAQLSNFFDTYAQNLGYKKYTDNWLQITQAGLGSTNPSEALLTMFRDNDVTPLPSYDVDVLTPYILSGTVSDYLAGAERQAYRSERSRTTSAVIAAAALTTEATIRVMLDTLEEYGLERSTYDGFGYTFENVFEDANASIISYQAQFDYRLSVLEERRMDEGMSDEEFAEAAAKMNDEVIEDVSSSFLEKLPEDVAGALEEVGQLDIYGLIVGNIYYEIAGLLMPIIYMILVINNMISGAVESGSMAYVLSTGTKREDVTLTQTLYIVLSLLAMFACTTVTSVIAFTVAHGMYTALTMGGIILFNVGAFLVLFALSGFCYAVSCFFDRSRYSLAIGGGLSIFALVSIIVGLFGSKIMPSIIRFDALNYFNYVTIISLFDILSITQGTSAIYWKLSILLVIGVTGYIVGALHFKKKDLPL